MAMSVFSFFLDEISSDFQDIHLPENRKLPSAAHLLSTSDDTKFRLIGRKPFHLFPLHGGQTMARPRNLDACEAAWQRLLNQGAILTS